MEPTVISTFAGCGGSSLGYKLAGYKELLANDFDENASEVFKLNFPETPFIQGDISKLSVEKVFEITGLKKGELDVFDGSPPCQGFSMSGKRKVSDPRNSLFKEYKRLLDGLSPKVFLMENVPSMATGSMKGVFNQIFSALSENYKVKAKVMDASDYGVPQSRRRMIFIGVRKDLNIEPSFPSPYKEKKTVEMAFEKVPQDEEIIYPFGKLALVSWKMRQGQCLSALHPRHSYFNLRKLAWNQPAWTMTKVFYNSTRFSGFLHPSEDRFITISEAKRLCSFPDDFQFTGTFAEKWARMGNSVMPLFMKAVAEHIKTQILGM